MNGPEKVRRHLSIRGGAHVTSVLHSSESVYSHLALQTLLYYYLTIIQGSTYWDLGQQNLQNERLLYRIRYSPQPGL